MEARDSMITSRSGDDLAGLLEAAATVGPRDTDAGERLRRDAHRVTARLVAQGRLPEHLRVRLDDPLVVVVRAVAAAWRLTAGASDRRPGRGQRLAA